MTGYFEPDHRAKIAVLWAKQRKAAIGLKEQINAKLAERCQAAINTDNTPEDPVYTTASRKMLSVADGVLIIARDEDYDDNGNLFEEVQFLKRRMSEGQRNRNTVRWVKIAGQKIPDWEECGRAPIEIANPEELSDGEVDYLRRWSQILAGAGPEETFPDFDADAIAATRVGRIQWLRWLIFQDRGFWDLAKSPPTKSEAGLAHSVISNDLYKLKQIHSAHDRLERLFCGFMSELAKDTRGIDVGHDLLATASASFNAKAGEAFQNAGVASFEKRVQKIVADGILPILSPLSQRLSQNPTTTPTFAPAFNLLLPRLTRIAEQGRRPHSPDIPKDGVVLPSLKNFPKECRSRPTLFMNDAMVARLRSAKGPAKFLWDALEEVQALLWSTSVCGAVIAFCDDLEAAVPAAGLTAAPSLRAAQLLKSLVGWHENNLAFSTLVDSSNNVILRYISAFEDAQ